MQIIAAELSHDIVIPSSHHCTSTVFDRCFSSAAAMCPTDCRCRGSGPTRSEICRPSFTVKHVDGPGRAASPRSRWIWLTGGSSYPTCTRLRPSCRADVHKALRRFANEPQHQMCRRMCAFILTTRTAIVRRPKRQLGDGKARAPRQSAQVELLGETQGSPR